MIRPTPFVQKVKPYTPPISGRADKIRLDFNESNFPPSPRVLEILDKELFLKNVNFYPEDSVLVSSIAKKFFLENQNIMVANGSNGIISALANTFLKAGDEVILPIPTFSIFELLFSVNGAKIKKVLYNPDFTFPAKKVLEAISSRTKAIVVVSPNNPTGTTINKDDMLAILEKAKNTLVLVDEAYCHFAKQNFLSLTKSFSNLVVLRTFSKAYSLGGLRIGYAVSNSQNIKNLHKANLPYRVNFFSMKAAEVALEDDESLNKNIKLMQSEKQKLEKGLNRLGVEYIQTKTNFIPIKLGLWSTMVHEEFEKQGILIRNIGSYPLLDGYLRVSVGLPFQNQIFLEQLETILASRVVIFDMDGTLINVDRSFILCVQKALKHYTGRIFTFTQIDEIRNEGGLNNDVDLIVAAAKREGKNLSFNQVLEYFDICYEKKKSNETLLIKHKALTQLSQKFSLAIFSGRTRQEAALAMENLKLKNYFKTVILAEDTGSKPKPHPFGICLVKKKHQSCVGVYVGDNVDDYKAATDADIACVLIARTQKQKVYFRKMGVKYILKNPNDLVDLL